MKKLFVCALAASLAAALLWASPAHASFVDWSYNWGRSPIAVSANAPGTGGISLTDETGQDASGSSDVVATNLRTFSSATRAKPDTFTNKTYTLTLSLKDDASGKSATLTFGGVFNGTLTAVNSNITNKFTGTTSQTVTLGGNSYSVVLGSYAPPGPPSAINAGSITAHVFVNEPIGPSGGGGSGGGGSGPTGPPGGSLPEPSTLVLSCLGLSCLGMRSYRKWFIAR
jgi:hypothetical protein